MKFCTNCGSQLPDEAVFCTNCGASFNEDINNAIGDEEGTSILVEEEEGTSILVEDDDEEGTSILVEEDEETSILIEENSELEVKPGPVVVKPVIDKKPEPVEKPTPVKSNDVEPKKPKKNKSKKGIIIAIIVVIVVVACGIFVGPTIVDAIYGHIYASQDNGYEQTEDSYGNGETAGNEIVESGGNFNVSFGDMGLLNMEIPNIYSSTSTEGERIIEGSFELNDVENNNLVGYVNVYDNDGNSYEISSYVDIYSNNFTIWIDNLPDDEYNVEILIEPENELGFVVAEADFSILIETL